MDNGGVLLWSERIWSVLGKTNKGWSFYWFAEGRGWVGIIGMHCQEGAKSAKLSFKKKSLLVINN